MKGTLLNLSKLYPLTSYQMFLCRIRGHLTRGGLESSCVFDVTAAVKPLRNFAASMAFSNNSQSKLVFFFDKDFYWHEEHACEIPTGFEPCKKN